MTLTGIRTAQKEVEKIQLMFPRPPDLSPEFQALLDSLSEDHLIELSNMLMGIRPDPRILPPGTLPETPRDCARCGFRLTGNAALLQHVPCNYLESGDFRP
jgi:hypothetical protein